MRLGDPLTPFILALSLLLTGCGRSAEADDRICSTPGSQPTVAAETLPEQQAIVDQCIHSWAYRLARSDARVEEVALATLGACQNAIDYLGRFDKRLEPTALAATRETQPRSYGQAIFRVTQARAGHCAIP